MGNDRLRIAERVEQDWRALNEQDRDSVRVGLMAVDEDPIIGAPLFEPLRGLWSLRIDAVRIVYKVVAEARFVVILAIGRIEERSFR